MAHQPVLAFAVQAQLHLNHQVWAKTGELFGRFVANAVAIPNRVTNHSSD
jgi:hypothetical protein